MKQIQIKQLSKRYGRVQALDQISTTFDFGKIYGLLGRNGAGKTTLLNLMTGRQFCDSGQILMDGLPLPEDDQLLGQMYMMSEAKLYPESDKIQKVFSYLPTFYPQFKLEKALDLAKRFDLDIRKKLSTLSTGYHSIFKLIVALSVGAPCILLDEPILGLDANARELFYKILISSFAENPSCIIISTHLIEEIAGIIEQVIIIDHGRILYDLPLSELLERGYQISGAATQVDAFAQDKNVIGEERLGGLKTVTILGTSNQDIPVGLECSRMDLQKFFVRLTNEKEA